jgi:hypothetical protein
VPFPAQELSVLTGSAAYRDKRKLSVSLCVFRAPLQQVVALDRLSPKCYPMT